MNKKKKYESRKDLSSSSQVLWHENTQQIDSVFNNQLYRKSQLRELNDLYEFQ